MASEQKLVIRLEANQDGESGVWTWTALVDAASLVETEIDMNAYTATGDAPLMAAYELIAKLCDGDELAENLSSHP